MGIGPCWLVTFVEKSAKVPKNPKFCRKISKTLDKVWVSEICYQATWTIGEVKTLARELGSLEKITDYNARYSITMDKEGWSYNDIQQLNAIKWLLGK